MVAGKSNFPHRRLYRVEISSSVLDDPFNLVPPHVVLNSELHRLVLQDRWAVPSSSHSDRADQISNSSRAAKRSECYYDPYIL